MTYLADENENLEILETLEDPRDCTFPNDQGMVVGKNMNRYRTEAGGLHHLTKGSYQDIFLTPHVIQHFDFDYFTDNHAMMRYVFWLGLQLGMVLHDVRSGNVDNQACDKTDRVQIKYQCVVGKNDWMNHALGDLSKVNEFMAKPGAIKPCQFFIKYVRDEIDES